MSSDILLSVRDLQTHLYTRRGIVRAVDGVSFDIRRGETLGLVGESGSGKSMTALSIMRLLPRQARIVGGQILLDGDDLVPKSDREMGHIRGRRVSMVLQDPLTSLNPVLRVGAQVVETIRRHRSKARNPRARAVDLLRQVHIPAAPVAYNYYPHQMSGGMRQRAVSAVAISSEPELLIADEPTSALDPTIQAQYLDLLREIQATYHLAILFITHDFGVVANICDSVAVMYTGRIVEQGPVREVFRNPSHPYTEALLRSVPDVSQRPERLPSISGQPPPPTELPAGCHFAPRCPYAMDRCRAEYPITFTTGPDQTARCWRALA